MRKKKCMTCLFGDRCYFIGSCEYYCPLDDNRDKVDRYIEDRRIEFYNAWIQYTSGW